MEIETERLILREYSIDDWQDVLEYQSQPDYLRFYDWSERDEQSVKEFVGQFISAQAEALRIKYQFAVTLSETGRLIGSAGIRKEKQEAVEGEIGVELNPAYWGKGYAAEAIRAVMRFGFDDLGLHRIWVKIISENIRSVRLVERVGMRLEGRLRENEWFKERWWDTLIYGMLDYEWYARENPGPGSNLAGLD